MYTNFTKKRASVEEKMFEFTKKVHTCSMFIWSEKNLLEKYLKCYYRFYKKKYKFSIIPKLYELEVAIGNNPAPGDHKSSLKYFPIKKVSLYKIPV